MVIFNFKQSNMNYTDESLMPFGKHKELPLEEVPASYLIWLEEQLGQKTNMNNTERALLAYIKDNWDVLQKEKNEYR